MPSAKTEICGGFPRSSGAWGYLEQNDTAGNGTKTQTDTDGTEGRNELRFEVSACVARGTRCHSELKTVSSSKIVRES